MTDMDASTKRRFTWSIGALGNRAAYSFVAAILANLAIHNTATALLIGFALFLMLSAIVWVGRRN